MNEQIETKCEAAMSQLERDIQEHGGFFEWMLSKGFGFVVWYNPAKDSLFLHWSGDAGEISYYPKGQGQWQGREWFGRSPAHYGMVCLGPMSDGSEDEGRKQ